MAIKLFIYQTSNGKFLYEDSGSEDGIIRDIDEDEDFTLIRPPHYRHPWYWVNNEWQSEPLVVAP